MSSSIALRRSPKPGAFTARAGERAAELVHDQRRERLALDVLGDDEERPPDLHDVLEEGDQVLHDADLACRERRMKRLLEHALHALRVGHEVGREVAAVELHALDDLERRLGRLRLLDRDDALGADLLDRVGDELADRRVVVRGDRRDLRLLAPARHRAGERLERLDREPEPAVEAALQVDRARAGDDVAQPFGEDRVREERRGASCRRRPRRPSARPPRAACGPRGSPRDPSARSPWRS